MAGSILVTLNFPSSSQGLDELRRGAGLVEVLHAKVEAHVVLVHKKGAEHEYQDYGERNREEHCGLLAVEALDADDEICADDA